MRQLLIHRGQAIERVIECEDGYDIGSDGTFRIIERHTWKSVAPLARTVAARVVNQNPAHDLCRDSKEMGSVLPVHVALIDQPQIDLVHQRRGLERVPRPLAAKLSCRDPAQLFVDEREQLIERTLVAATPVAKERRHIARRGHQTVGVRGPE